MFNIAELNSLKLLQRANVHKANTNTLALWSLTESKQYKPVVFENVDTPDDLDDDKLYEFKLLCCQLMLGDWSAECSKEAIATIQAIYAEMDDPIMMAFFDNKLQKQSLVC